MAVPRTLLFVGGYTGANGIGIRTFDATDPAGELVELSETSGIENPSYLVPHPSGRTLYAVSETANFDDAGSGAIVAYDVDPNTGELREVERVASRGADPCHLTLDASASILFCANYSGGSVVAYRLETDGTLGPLLAHRQHEGNGPTSRQDGPHAHCVRPGPDDRSMYAVDLGTDQVIRYEHGPAELATELRSTSTFSTAPGAGPRHLAIHSTGTMAVLVNELDNSVQLLAIGDDGTLSPIDVRSSRRPNATGPSIAADVQIDPSGQHVYVSNRGDDTVAVFRIEPTHLEPLGHVPSGGATPRSMVIHPSGRRLLVSNQDSDNIVMFDLDETTAVPERPIESRHRPTSPTCLAMVEVST